MSENFYEEGGGADIADGYRTPVSVDTNDQVGVFQILLFITVTLLRITDITVINDNCQLKYQHK